MTRWCVSLFCPDNSSRKFNITEYTLLPEAAFLFSFLATVFAALREHTEPCDNVAQIGCLLLLPWCSSTVINSLFKFQSRQGFNPSGIGFGCGSHSSPPSNCSWEIIPHQYCSFELGNRLEINITWALRAWLAGDVSFLFHKFNADKTLCWFKRMIPWMQKKKMEQSVLNSK